MLWWWRPSFNNWAFLQCTFEVEFHEMLSHWAWFGIPRQCIVGFFKMSRIYIRNLSLCDKHRHVFLTFHDRLVIFTWKSLGALIIPPACWSLMSVYPSGTSNVKFCNISTRKCINSILAICFPGHALFPRKIHCLRSIRL